MRLNVGCGEYPIDPHWVNLDADPSVNPDLVAAVPPLPCVDGSLSEIFACHFLEHLTFEDAEVFLAECYRCLQPGGGLGVVVPDARAVMGMWLAQIPGQTMEYPPGVYHAINDLDEICKVFIYSTVQKSPHRWCYDLKTLSRLVKRSGFEVVAEIDRYRDTRIGSPQWYQCGIQARKHAH